MIKQILNEQPNYLRNDVYALPDSKTPSAVMLSFNYIHM